MMGGLEGKSFAFVEFQQVGFEQGDAVEAPGGVGEFADELNFGGSCGLVFVEEGPVMGFEGGGLVGDGDVVGGC
jgi:hypothetical protein